MRWIAVMAAVGVLLAGCSEDEGSDDPTQDAAAQAQCTSTVRFEGMIYRGLIGRAKQVPTGQNVGTADVAACDDTDKNSIGSYFPSDPDQVEVVALKGYPTSEVIGVQRSDRVDVYAAESLPRTRADAITAELLEPAFSE